LSSNNEISGGRTPAVRSIQNCESGAARTERSLRRRRGVPDPGLAPEVGRAPRRPSISVRAGPSSSSRARPRSRCCCRRDP
jgi:hypothetical protein